MLFHFQEVKVINEELNIRMQQLISASLINPYILLNNYLIFSVKFKLSFGIFFGKVLENV